MIKFEIVQIEGQTPVTQEYVEFESQEEADKYCQEISGSQAQYVAYEYHEAKKSYGSMKFS